MTGIDLADAYLDEDGLLRRGDRWVAIPLGQLPVARLLLHHLGHAVGIEDIATAYVGAGGSGRRTSVRTALHRLGQRVAPLGLSLESVGQGSVILHAPAASHSGH